ncbi:MAG TPA: 50S ribosomal protein L21 [Phycisphaerae bacterium]|nr:50S ribosomal protein L21 [Phycisphaerae bacterium]
MYAIIEDSGQQFRVTEGDVLEVDLRELADSAESIVFDRVLLIGDDDKIKVGQPTVKGAKVTAEIVDARAKGPKLHIYHWRRRKASRTKVGHRQKYVRVRVTKIKG